MAITGDIFVAPCLKELKEKPVTVKDDTKIV